MRLREFRGRRCLHQNIMTTNLHLNFIRQYKKYGLHAAVQLRLTNLYQADLGITWDVLARLVLTNMSQNVSLHIVSVVPNPSTSWIQ